MKGNKEIIKEEEQDGSEKWKTNWNIAKVMVRDRPGMEITQKHVNHYIKHIVLVFGLCAVYIVLLCSAFRSLIF